MTFKALLLAGCMMAGNAMAADWIEPARGSEARSDLMDAIRGHAEWELGAPVQFVVNTLRVHGDKAFASLNAQRPGGAPIDLASTPAADRGMLYLEDIDGARYDVFFTKVGRTWVALEWSLGGTDAWWAEPMMCSVFGAVIPEYCVGLN